ncbi:MAG: HPr kinase/phosphorylase [Chlamydiae bacterium CG10_big_fil_rev_8_21_14_0_10_35_9]|nr:MAG: HPr kinase/phosphorylase [Chlamydiae bacterium CG10_big_fil_rev_8_21_14_0_10_35_9]
MYQVQSILNQHKRNLQLELLAGKAGLNRKIRKPEVHRPGLSLTGYMKNFIKSRIFLFGRGEIQYLKELSAEIRFERLKAMLTNSTPAVFLSRKMRPLKELLVICEQNNIPLFQSKMHTVDLFSKLTLLLSDEFCPSVTLHGTLIEVFGVGVLIKGESSVGKSEAALGLIERGHRLISDDVVKVRKKEGSFLIGEGPELTRHLMEIRGIGIINVANLYGAVCVRPDKGLDIVVQLEEWDDQHFYDRVGLEEKYTDILDINIPFHLLPVKPGRDVILLIETIALNHRLKGMGYNSAKEFNMKLLETLAKRKRKIRQSSPLKEKT